MARLTEQQQQAVISHATKILVSAGAGSGKTHVLVERYIERLKQDTELGVNSLIAVTFTRKAASEMRIRLKKRMQELNDAAEGDQRERWSKCLAEVDGARIGTIHSLCETIIKSFPLDAGVDPQLEVLDELSQARLLQESINQAFREVIDENSPEHELLLEFDMLQIRQWLGSVLKSSLQFRESVSGVAGLSTEEFIAHATTVIEKARSRALSALAGDRSLWSAVAALNSAPDSEMTAALNDFRLGAITHSSVVMELTGKTGAIEPQVQERVWSALIELSLLQPKNTGGNKPGAKITRAAIKMLRELATDLTEKIPATLSEADTRAFQFAQHFMALAARTQRIYSTQKKDSFCADYNDLIELALSALDAPASAARRFYNAATAEIMVDEFQDTNKVQSQLLSLLAGPETRLFLIGDDKQSIYKFQGADVSTFNEWKDRIGNAESGSLLSLSRSFRSHPQIVNFVNALFSELMGDKGASTLFDATFQSLEAARDDDQSYPKARVDIVCYSDGAIDAGRRSEQNRRAEARAVADWINGKVAEGAVVHEKSGETRPIQFGDFAVLVQRNRDFSWIEKAFIANNVPYVMMGGRNFLERQEIYDMENLLSFLSSPLNDHALIAVLRSPMFAVGDDLLQLMANMRGTSIGFWSTMLSVARQRKAGFEPVRRAVSLLKPLLEDAQRLQLSELLRRAIERTGYDIVLLGLQNGKQRSRNLWKLVALAADRQELSVGDFAETLRLMREFNVQQTDASLDTHDSVKLMTIHSSKGLEFPAVILPVLDATSGPRTDRVVFHPEYGMAFNTARTDNDPKPTYFQVANSINEEMELAEKKRLFYVAATRARDYLGLFFNQEAKNTPSFRTWLREWLGLDQSVEEGAQQPGNSQAQTCSLNFIEVLDEPAEAPLTEAATKRKSIGWDLIWPTMDGEMAAPPPNPGVRITWGESRQRLEASVLGNVFHSIMEHLQQDMAPISDEMLQCVVFAQGDPVADLRFREELLKQSRLLLANFYESDLFVALKNARQRFHEFPYLLTGSNAVSRRPDLIFEDSRGGWHLVDYKTERLEKDQIEEHLQRHAKQLDEYARELGALTSIKFAPAVYFAHLGILSTLQKTPLSFK